MTRATDGKGGRELNGKLSSSYTFQTVNSSSLLLFCGVFSISLGRIVHSFNYSQFLRHNIETENRHWRSSLLLNSVRTMSLNSTSFTGTLREQVQQVSTILEQLLSGLCRSKLDYEPEEPIFVQDPHASKPMPVSLSSCSDILSQSETQQFPWISLYT